MKRLGIEWDDWTTDDDEHIWSQVCLECIDKHQIPDEIRSNPGSGICGIKGCTNEADDYIDFPDEPDPSEDYTLLAICQKAHQQITEDLKREIFPDYDTHKDYERLCYQLERAISKATGKQSRRERS